MSKPDYYEATESFGVMVNGEQMTVHAGEYVPAHSPLLKQVGLEHFKPVESFGRWDVPAKTKPEAKAKPEPKVEQATAAPGEKRGSGAG